MKRWNFEKMILQPPGQKNLVFLNPRPPRKPQTQFLYKSQSDLHQILRLWIGFCRRLILQALGELAASRRGSFSHENNVPEDVQHVSNNMFVCFIISCVYKPWVSRLHPAGFFPS